jgi:hypothetical protein
MGELLEREIERLEGRLDRASDARAIGELATVRRGLASPGPREPAIELTDLRLGFVCKERWEDMVGDDRVRACGGCARPVFNLSAMTRAEADAVLATRGLTPCVRFYRRSDGTVMTTDCPTSPRRGARRLAVVAAGATLVAAPTAFAEPPADDQTKTGITLGQDYVKGIPVPGRTFDAVLAPIATEAPPPPAVKPKRPMVEWSAWGRLGLGVASRRSDLVARSVIVPPAADASTPTWEAAVAADLTLPVVRDGNLRLGAWGEARTTSGPVAGGEVVLEDLPPHWKDSAGSLVLRLGANTRVVTAALGVGFVGAQPSSDPWIRWARHVVGARVVLSVNRAIDEPHDWSATVGLEVEPIGAIRAVVDAVTGR